MARKTFRITAAASATGTLLTMEATAVDRTITPALEALRKAGALFVYLHGSRANRSARPESDIDLAAYFAPPVPAAFDVLLPRDVDLLVLNGAPLELAGRVASTGRLLYDGDPVARVRWESTTRKIYYDELPRIQRAHQEFLESLRHG